jgi:hypothetical protein
MSDTRRAATETAVLDLLRASLAQWGADVSVALAKDGKISILWTDADILIARAPSELPFRWVVDVGGRQRAASSVTGLLRIVRGTIAPAWRPGRARIAPLPPVAP